MKLVYTTENPLLISHLQNILENNQIACITKNTFLTSAIGRLPPIECWPELWVVNDTDLLAAQALISEALAPASTPHEFWTCTHCGEELEPQFTACWNCGTERDKK